MLGQVLLVHACYYRYCLLRNTVCHDHIRYANACKPCAIIVQGRTQSWLAFAEQDGGVCHREEQVTPVQVLCRVAHAVDAVVAWKGCLHRALQ